ncbi:MAG TPA: ROK family protein [Polyangiaceae bacterium]|jgi:glucokinase-like ROK family protein|nr:ROK family protein [Polyangiaceae bacterium]
MQQDVQGKVDSRAMREVNRSIVLDIIRRGGRVSRTDLARRSTLTKPTVSAIVEDLIAGGIVQEVGFGKTVASGGRRARLLEFNDHSAAYLGIRFGVGTTMVGIADARGEIRATGEVATTHGDARQSLADALALIDEVVRDSELPRERLKAVGVTVPGLVNQASGEVTLAPNLAWRAVPMRALVREALGLPVVVTNVTNAGAIAEGRVGAARGVRSFVWVHVGTGVGAGIMIDGQLFNGHLGYSGEIGHCPVVSNGPLCPCGLRGCLEQLASSAAMTRAAEQAVLRGEQTLLAGFERRDARALTVAARAGDTVALRILTQAGEFLGIGLSFLMNLLNPEMLVLGGSVSDAAEFLLGPLRSSAARHTLAAENVKIVSSTLGDRAALVGSVLTAMDLSVRSYRVVATGERMALG